MVGCKAAVLRPLPCSIHCTRPPCLVRPLGATALPRNVRAASNVGAEGGTSSSPPPNSAQKKRVPVTVVDDDTGQPLHSFVLVAPSSSVFTAGLKKPLGMVLAGGRGSTGAEACMAGSGSRFEALMKQRSREVRS